MEKLIKHQSSAELQRELSDLNKLLILHNENEFILSSLNFKNIEEMESYVLDKTGFKNIQMGMMALGYEEDYNIILKNTEAIADKFCTTDLVDGKFSDEFIQKVTDKHTTFLNEREIKIAKFFNKMIADLNKLELTPEEKRHIVFDNYYNLRISPFSYLRNV